MFSREPGYNLPFEVWAYYHLRKSEQSDESGEIGVMVPACISMSKDGFNSLSPRRGTILFPQEARCRLSASVLTARPKSKLNSVDLL